jgi:pimeloyl-ACP methyl ester carboxylesterase
MAVNLIKESAFNTGKVQLNYVEGPNSGPALVLLHGGSAWWQDFSDIIPALSSHWHVYAPDLRGHGKSGRVPWGYAIRDYAEDIQVFLREISGEAILFGHSFGGMIALMAAGQSPDLVRAVIAGDSPLDRAAHKIILDRRREELREWQSLVGGSHSVAEISTVVKDNYRAGSLYQQDPDVLGILLDDFELAHEGYEMETLLPSIRCPVLLLQPDPERGSTMSDAEVARALTLLARPTHVKLPGLSSMFLWEDRQRVLNAIEDFLNQV